MRIHVEIWRSHHAMVLAKHDETYHGIPADESRHLIRHYMVDTSDAEQRRVMGTQIANCHQAAQAVLTYAAAPGETCIGRNVGTGSFA